MRHESHVISVTLSVAKGLCLRCDEILQLAALASE